jgi:photosystem II stability/assembly factor-like uncharacterized protein
MNRLIVRIRDIIGLFSLSVICNVSFAQWQPITEPLGEFEQYLNMSFTNDSTGYVISQLYDPDTLYHKVLKTTDYGLNWNSILDIAQENNTLSNYLTDIFFINEEIGWICGSNMSFILKTIDGGQSWQIQEVEGADAFSRIEFANASFGIAFNGQLGGSAVETFDGGLTWALNTLHSGYDGSFLDECTYLTVRSSAIRNYQECDLQIIPFPTNGEFGDHSGRCIYMKNPNEWIAGSIGLIGLSNFGSILTTHDGGETFSILDLNFSTSVSDLFFLTDEIGFARVSAVDDIPCKLLKTSNGGISWSCQETPLVLTNFGDTVFGTFIDMDLRNENLMYALGYRSIFRTTNGGGPLGDTYTGVKVMANKTRTLNIYPNPTSSIVRLELSDARGVKEIEMYNSVGQHVETNGASGINGNSSQPEIEVGHLAPGCYTVVVRYEKEIIRSRFVVE